MGFLVGFGAGLITFLAGRLTRYFLGFAAILCILLLQRTLPYAINVSCNLQDTLDFCIVVFWGEL